MNKSDLDDELPIVFFLLIVYFAAVIFCALTGCAPTHGKVIEDGRANELHGRNF